MPREKASRTPRRGASIGNSAPAENCRLSERPLSELPRFEQCPALGALPFPAGGLWNVAGSDEENLLRHNADVVEHGALDPASQFFGSAAALAVAADHQLHFFGSQ